MANERKPPTSASSLPPLSPKPPNDAAGHPPSSDAVARRDFLKAAGAGAGLLLLGACGSSVNPDVPGIQRRRRVPLVGGSSADVVVVGAGAWGGWTAFHLRQMGAKVTL